MKRAVFALISGADHAIFLREVGLDQKNTVFFTPFLGVKLKTATKNDKDEWIIDDNPHWKLSLHAEQPQYVQYKLTKNEHNL